MHIMRHHLTVIRTRTGTLGLTSTQSLQLLVLQLLASTQVISEFGTPGTHGYSVISAFGTPGTR